MAKRTTVTRQEIEDLVAKTSRDVIFILNVRPKLHYRFISPSVRRALGYSTEAFYRDAYFTFKVIHPSDRTKLEELSRKPELHAGEPVELRFLTSKHEIKWFEQVTHALFDQKGGFVGIEGIARDITDRKEEIIRARLLSDIGKALTQSLDFKSRMISLANLVVPTFCSWCVIDFLKGAGIERITVTSLGHDSVAKTLGTKFPGPDQKAEATLLNEIAKRTPSLYYPITDEMLHSWLEKDEHFRLVRELGATSMISVPLYSQNKALGIIVFVSHQKFNQSDIAFAEEIGNRAAMAADNAILLENAKRAVWARNELLAVVSHDLKNPLTAIELNAGMLSNLYQDPSANQRVLKHVDIIRTAAKRSLGLISDLLDLSRLDLGVLPAKKQVLELNDLFEPLVDEFRASAEAKGIRLSFKSFGKNVRISGDGSRLKQALGNLISNAIKFTSSGGYISIILFSEDGNARIEIQDTGIGIPEKDLPHIFDRFWQPRRSEKSGAGLGLSITKAIIEVHGGHVFVESTKDKGSLFTIVLPMIHAIKEAA